MCVQLTEKTMNLSSLSRLSQAAPLAVMPAHGSGDGSGKETVTVWPILKSSIFPTGTHDSFALPNNGAITNPTSGSPRIVAQTPLKEMESLAKKRLRVRSCEVGASGGRLWMFSFMANF